MRRRFSQIASIVPVIVAGTFACVPSVFAASAPPMTVSVESASGATGNYFEVSGQAGQTTSAGSLALRNQTGERITVLLDSVRGLTASTLGSAYGLRGSKANGPASWVVLGQRRVLLAPRAGVRVPVSVSVPSSAEPGDYLAGISVQAGGAASEVELKGNVAISQVQRYAVGLVTTLPGPRNPSIKLTDVRLDREPSGVTFKIRGRNNGNVILQNVKGTATISEGGDEVANRKLGPGTFVTGTSIAYPLLVPSLHPDEGAEFRVQAVLRYPGGVARIDRVVRFGEIDAKRQQEYGGPQMTGGDDGNKLLLILLIVAGIAGCLAALEIRRRRGGSGEAALRRVLPREIAHARASGEPLSVTLVPADGGRSPRELATGVRGSLRSRDRLFRLKRSGLVIVSPDTTPEAGEMLAAEIRRDLARSGNGAAAVIPVTSAAESSAEELLEAAAAVGADGAEVANGDAGNGAGHQGTVEHRSQDEVKHSGTEVPAVGTPDGTHRTV
jgi:hypothetical protein